MAGFTLDKQEDNSEVQEMKERAIAKKIIQMLAEEDLTIAQVKNIGRTIRYHFDDVKFTC